MCGIAGIVNVDGTPVRQADIEAMTLPLQHRGPDGQGIWRDGAVAFGHRRLAIRDLGPGGQQPVQSADATVTAVFNGEIYNDHALKRTLSREFGTRFHTDCDAEVIAPGWMAWGEGLFDRIEGMFAIAIWDSRTERLILARDPAGIKPLFVRRAGEAIHFASEVKALLALPGAPGRLSAPDLHRYLASGYVGPTRSLIEDIVQVPPGSISVMSREGTRHHTFWRPVRSGDIRTVADALDGFNTVWPQVVSDMLISDVPVGVLLSSGLDSALVAAELAGTNRTAFTGRFPVAAWDESSLAADTARAAGLRHHVADVHLDDEAERTFRRVVAHVDGQLADSSCVPFFRVCEEARKVVPVLLSGDGADEYFGGYPTYRATRLAEAVRPLLPRAVTTPAARVLATLAARSRVPVSAAEQLGRLCAGIAASAPGQSHPQWRRYLMQHQQAGLYGPGLQDLLHVDPLDEYAAAMTGDHLVDRCLMADQVHYLPADMLAKADRMSMAHGLEIRVPFLDRRVMEFAGRLAHPLLTTWRGPDKALLRHAMGSRPGRARQARSPKRGFNMPVALTLRRGLRALGDHYLDHQPDCLAPWLDADGIRRLWRDHQSERVDHGYVLWTLLTLAVWITSVSAVVPRHAD